MKEPYYVFYAPEGCGEVYLGCYVTLKEARRAAAAHDRGELAGLAQCDYGTALAAGHICGFSAPPATGEAVQWFGRGGWYCACHAK